MTSRKTFVILNIVVVAFVWLSLPGSVKAQVTAPPFQAIVDLLRSFGDVTHSWSVALDPAERYAVLRAFNDEAVLDRNTGLVWQRTPNTVIPTLSWGEARYHCLNTIIGDQKGWRLPTVTELTSLQDPKYSNPVLPPGSPFGSDASVSNIFWSSSIYESYQTPVFVVNFGTGTVTGDSINNHYSTRCVRGGANVELARPLGTS